MTCESKLIEYLKENSKYGFQTTALAKKLKMKVATVHSIRFKNKDLIDAYTIAGKRTTYYIIKENA
jgi:hypothetical protein